MTVTLIKPFKFRRNGLISVYKKSWLKIGNCLDQGDWIVYFASKSLQPTSSRSSYSKKNFQRLIIIIISKKGSAKREFDIILSGTKSWREVFWKPTRFRRKVKVFRNEVVKSPGRGKRFLEDLERKKGKWNDRLFTELRWYRDRNLEFPIRPAVFATRILGLATRHIHFSTRIDYLSGNTRFGPLGVVNVGKNYLYIYLVSNSVPLDPTRKIKIRINILPAK